MDAVARVKNLRGSARKARLILDLIRGKDIDEARKILNFSNKRFSGKIEKLLNSAVASVTERESKANLDRYFISQVYADDGPIMRRYMPRALGRANIIRKRTCHITLTLSQKEDMDSVMQPDKNIAQEAKKVKSSRSDKKQEDQGSKTSAKKTETKEA